MIFARPARFAITEAIPLCSGSSGDQSQGVSHGNRVELTARVLFFQLVASARTLSVKARKGRRSDIAYNIIFAQKLLAPVEKTKADMHLSSETELKQNTSSSGLYRWCHGKTRDTTLGKFGVAFSFS